MCVGFGSLVLSDEGSFSTLAQHSRRHLVVGSALYCISTLLHFSRFSTPFARTRLFSILGDSVDDNLRTAFKDKVLI